MNRAPLRYIDPSGHKSKEKWAEEYEAAHNGQEPTEQDWWDYQFSLQFSDWSAAAWETTSAIRQIMFLAGVTIRKGFDDGEDWHRAFCPGFDIDPVIRWTVDEVMAVGRAVTNVVAVFGLGAIQGVTITRMHNALYPGIYFGDPVPAWEGLLTVYMNDSAFPDAEGTVIHELGHYMQESHTGSMKEFLASRVGPAPTDYGCWGGPYEDFADSFMVFVYQELGISIRGINPQKKYDVLNIDASRSAFFSRFVEW